MNPQVDHLVVASPTIDEGIKWAERILGCTPEPGGKHQGFGTHNVLLGLGNDCYLEIVSKDPEQGEIPAHWIPANDVQETKLIGWASTRSNLDAFSRKYSNILGSYAAMSREKPDGTLISWRMTYPRFSILNGMIPFLIDWGRSPHPGSILTPVGCIHQFHLAHPENDVLEQILKSLGFEIEVRYEPQPKINCELLINDQLIKL